MSVLSLAIGAASAQVGDVPCRAQKAELWFADDVASTVRAQVLCQGCPLRTDCLAGALERREPCGVWGGELFERGQIVAGHKPKGRPRKDADEIASAAANRVAQRLAEVSLGLAQTQPELADLVAEAATDIRGVA
ncbi:MAG: WhiB family transcriptional regulator [Actinobacteria bacterium]|nr:WhiB family transcriptional regulator [Actinomycetota bacterium]